MPRFNLELIEGPGAEQILAQRIEELADRIESGMPNGGTSKRELRDGPESRESFFVRDLRARKYWHTFSYIDGTQELEDSGDRAARQDAVQLRYGHEIIQEAFTLAVNSAFMPNRYDMCNPGHSILHERVASNRESMFYDSITPKFQERLHNGRFYEMLPNLGGGALNGVNGQVEDVLVNHLADLDVNKVPWGLQIFERRNGPVFDYNMNGRDQHPLSERAIAQYGRFLEQVDGELGRLGVSVERFEPLVRPYVKALTGVDRDGIPFVEYGHAIAKDPWLQKYQGRVDAELVR